MYYESIIEFGLVVERNTDFGDKVNEAAKDSLFDRADDLPNIAHYENYDDTLCWESALSNEGYITHENLNYEDVMEDEFIVIYPKTAPSVIYGLPFRKKQFIDEFREQLEALGVNTTNIRDDEIFANIGFVHGHIATR